MRCASASAATRRVNARRELTRIEVAMTANNPTLDVAAGAAAYTVRIRGSTSGDMWIVRAVSDRNSSWRALGEWQAAESSHLA